MKRVPFKTIVIIAMTIWALMLTIAYFAGIKEIATPEGLGLAVLFALFIFMFLKKEQLKQREFNSFIQELKNGRKSDK